jgi:hypothetical protein
MSYFLILDSDYPPAGNMFTFIASNPSQDPLLQVKTFDATERKTAPIGTRVFTFVVSHELQDAANPGGALVPAAIYSA